MQWLQDAYQSWTGEAPATPESLEQAEQPTATLQTSITRAQLLHFFAAGESLLKSDATRRKLKDARLLKQVLHAESL